MWTSFEIPSNYLSILTGISCRIYIAATRPRVPLFIAFSLSRRDIRTLDLDCRYIATIRLLVSILWALGSKLSDTEIAFSHLLCSTLVQTFITLLINCALAKLTIVRSLTMLRHLSAPVWKPLFCYNNGVLGNQLAMSQNLKKKNWYNMNL